MPGCPSMLKRLRQNSGWPLLQSSQMPHMLTSSMITRSPGFTVVTFLPTSSTSAAISWPSAM